jgi:hypothetical protein
MPKEVERRRVLLALGFAGCSMPSYDRALHALRSWLDRWSGVGHDSPTSATGTGWDTAGGVGGAVKAETN